MIALEEIKAFKYNIAIIHYELENVGKYDISDAGLCYAITHANGPRSSDAYAILPELFTELNYINYIEPIGKWGPHRLGLICLLNALSVEELYEIANSEVHQSCQA